MRTTPEDIDRLILDIHAAPLDETRWAGIAQSLSAIVKAESAMLFSVPLERSATFWNVIWQIDPTFTRDYGLEYAPEDPWALAAKHLPSSMVGRIVNGDELVDRRDFLRSRFFNEFLVPYDISHFMCALLRDPMFPGAPPGAAFSFYRGKKSAPFGDEEHKIISRLAPHLVLSLH